MEREEIVRRKFGMEIVMEVERVETLVLIEIAEMRDTI